MKIHDTLKQATEQLSPSSNSARIDAEILLGHLLNKPKSYLYAWPELELSAEQYAAFSTLLTRRQQGEPIAYILGKKEFWSCELSVSPATLIPRPETEQLVELALAQLPENNTCRVLDLGTGSGAIAIAIAKERPHCQVLATDCSTAALSVATRNRDHYCLHNLQLQQSNWFENIEHGLQFDIIIANPPYIAPDDAHLTRGDLRFEPSQALSSRKQGLADLYHIAEYARNYLKQQGWLMMEHGFDQGPALIKKLHALAYDHIEDYPDYNNQPRAICARWSKQTKHAT